MHQPTRLSGARPNNFKVQFSAYHGLFVVFLYCTTFYNYNYNYFKKGKCARSIDGAAKIFCTRAIRHGARAMHQILTPIIGCVARYNN